MRSSSSVASRRFAVVTSLFAFSSRFRLAANASGCAAAAASASISFRNLASFRRSVNDAVSDRAMASRIALSTMP
jgi:hypothetical protein